MRKRYYYYLVFIFAVFFHTMNIYAFDSSSYRNKALCANFEIDAFYTDGTIEQKGCYNTYSEAKTAMMELGGKELAILTPTTEGSSIIDANVGLVDLSVNPETITYFYTNQELTGSAYTYMDTGSLYGGVDGVQLDAHYSGANNTWAAKVRIGNFTGWIKKTAYEVVPITWIKSTSTYTVTASDIRHNYVAKIQNTYTGNSGRTIGPKPEMLKEGTYYSYDGHYFYTDLETLIRDNRQNTYEHSVNKDNPYYNYYMYLSNHTDRKSVV